MEGKSIYAFKVAGKLPHKRNNCFRFTPTIVQLVFLLNEANYCSSCVSSLRWHGRPSAEVNENINLGYSQDQGYS